MVSTVLGVSSRACLGFRTAPANAWGLAVSWISGRETEDRMERRLFCRRISCEPSLYVCGVRGLIMMDD